MIILAHILLSYVWIQNDSSSQFGRSTSFNFYKRYKIPFHQQPGVKTVFLVKSS